MARFTDEMLMAYADGVLSKEEAQVIERALREGDDESRDAIDDFRKSADLVRAAFAGDEHEPIPDTLVRMVLDTGTAPKPSVTPLRRSRFDRYAMAMAAGIAAVAVVGGLTVALRPSATVTAEFQVGPVQPGTSLANLLAKVPSSVPVASGTKESGAAQLMVVGTFLDKSDRVCREIELMDAALAPQQVAVACRERAADAWSIEGVARIAAAPDPSRDAPGYAPAGASESDAIKGLQSMLGVGEPLSAGEERSLIENGWRR